MKSLVPKTKSQHYSGSQSHNFTWLMPIVITTMFVGGILLTWMIANMVIDGTSAANITIIVIGSYATFRVANSL